MTRVFRQRGAGPRAALWLAVFGVFLFAVGAWCDERVQLFPRLHGGETLQYESRARLNRYVKTKSNVATMFEPTPVQADISMNLQLSVHDFHEMDHRPMMAAEAQLFSEDSSASATSTAPSHPTKIDFMIGGDGNLSLADGLDNLEPQLRMAWQFWVAQFAFGWTLPSSGAKPGEKWKTTEVETAPMPIAKLVWERETTYVQNEKCPIVPDQQCAVFLVTATLKQKSNPQDTTPEDYKLNQLKTSGTAKGSNQGAVYISRKTGLLVRATEDIQQSLDVTIAKSDGSNQVQYLVDVTSHFETVFVPPALSAAR
ncbi:MAG: hypothetical protein WAM58_19925 [Candidatus Acidiferrum sp.]